MIISKQVGTFQHLFITHEWKLHRDFLEVMESQLREFLEKWQGDLNQTASEIDDEYERYDFYDIYFEDQQVMREYEALLMNSFFVASFALFENQLRRICDYLYRRQPSPNAVGKFHGNVPSAGKYMAKFDIPFPSDEPEWSRIDKYRKIRNKVVHSGGYVFPNWDIFTFADGEGIVGGSGSEQKLELTRPFCEQAVLDFESFMLKVSRATRQEGRVLN